MIQFYHENLKYTWLECRQVQSCLNCSRFRVLSVSWSSDVAQAGFTGLLLVHWKSIGASFERCEYENRPDMAGGRGDHERNAKEDHKTLVDVWRCGRVDHVSPFPANSWHSPMIYATSTLSSSSMFSRIISNSLRNSTRNSCRRSFHPFSGSSIHQIQSQLRATPTANLVPIVIEQTASLQTIYLNAVV